METINLFDDTLGERHALHQLYFCNDEIKETHFTFDELFDYHRYTHLIGVTYSISASLINRCVARFMDASIVVGLPEFEMINAVHNSISRREEYEAQVRRYVQQTAQIKQTVATMNKLTPDALQALNKKQITLLVPYAGNIHAKFYLLWNAQGDTRVVVGSANFSRAAFSDTNLQYESINIFDNQQTVFDYYQKYYHELQQIADLHPYLPQTLVKQVRQHLQKNPQQHLNVNVDVDTEQGRQVLSGILADYHHNLISNLDQVDKPVSSMTLNVMYNDAHTDTSIQQAEQQTVQKFDRDIVVHEVVKHGKKDANVVAPQVFKKQVMTMLTPYQAKQAELPLLSQRLILTYDDNRTNDVDSGLTRECSDGTTVRLGTVATKDTIRKFLSFFDQLITSYQTNPLGHYTDAYGKRIMEIILYAFNAPFVSIICNKLSNEYVRKVLMQFVLIGGAGGSGKSSLLQIATQLTGLPYKYQQDQVLASLGYEQLQQSVGNNKTYQQISTMITMEMNADKCKPTTINLNPLKIDDIANNYFNDKRFENLVKNVVNHNTRFANTYFPTFIGTTNNKSFKSSTQLGRRLAYIELGQTFPNRSNSQGDQDAIDASHRTLAELEEQAMLLGDVLFQDVARQMNNYFHDDTFDWDFVFSKGDPLILIRRIFKHYYQQCDLPLPAYFPQQYVDDVAPRDKAMWQGLYDSLSCKADYFVMSDDQSHLIIDLNQAITDNSYGHSKKIEQYRNALPAYVTDDFGNSNDSIISLLPLPFLQWIDRYYDGVNRWYDLVVCTKAPLSAKHYTKLRYDTKAAAMQVQQQVLQAMGRHKVMIINQGQSYVFNHVVEAQINEVNDK